jgi:hypothetical protein
MQVALDARHPEEDPAMTRAAERPVVTDTNDHDDDLYWDVEGERPDTATSDALNLAHRAIDKFPELRERYKNFAGPVAVASSALLVLAGVAVAARLKRGQNAEEILAEITPDEIEKAGSAPSRKARLWRMVRRIARRRSQESGSK